MHSCEWGFGCLRWRRACPDPHSGNIARSSSSMRTMSNRVRRAPGSKLTSRTSLSGPKSSRTAEQGAPSPPNGAEGNNPLGRNSDARGHVPKSRSVATAEPSSLDTLERTRCSPGATSLPPSRVGPDVVSPETLLIVQWYPESILPGAGARLCVRSPCRARPDSTPGAQEQLHGHGRASIGESCNCREVDRIGRGATGGFEGARRCRSRRLPHEMIRPAATARARPNRYS